MHSTIWCLFSSMETLLSIGDIQDLRASLVASNEIGAPGGSAAPPHLSRPSDTLHPLLLIRASSNLTSLHEEQPIKLSISTPSEPTSDSPSFAGT